MTTKMFLILIVLVSIVDLLMNVLSFIPIIGDILETISETGLELIQIGLAGALAAMK